MSNVLPGLLSHLSKCLIIDIIFLIVKIVKNQKVFFLNCGNRSTNIFKSISVSDFGNNLFLSCLPIFLSFFPSCLSLFPICFLLLYLPYLFIGFLAFVCISRVPSRLSTYRPGSAITLPPPLLHSFVPRSKYRLQPRQSYPAVSASCKGQTNSSWSESVITGGSLPESVASCTMMLFVITPWWRRNQAKDCFCLFILSERRARS